MASRVAILCAFSVLVLALAGEYEQEAGSSSEVRWSSTARRPSRRVRRPTMLAVNASSNTCPEDKTKLLSNSTSCCYLKLVMNPDCCVDQVFDKGVAARSIQRPGMTWKCKEKTCYDSLTGPRGKDLMWIPDGANCASPRILYVHGGSWSYGSPNTSGYGQFATRLAIATGAVVFVVDYPLLPYGNYSTILQWSIQALQWLAEHGPDDSCTPDIHAPLFVGGDSSGGGTALSVVLQLQGEPDVLKGRHISGVFLFSPWTNLMCNTPEYYTNAFAQIKSPMTFQDLTPLQQYVGDIIFQAITEDNAAAFSGNAVDYVGNNASLQTDPIASPYFADPWHFSGKDMPPLHIMVGGSESILGDSVRVANVAAQGGATVSVEVYSGMWHVFPMYSEGCGSGETLWAAQNAIESTGAFVRAFAPKGSKARYTLELVHSRKETHSRNLPLISYMYDPMVSRFSRVGELLKGTTWGYHQMMKKISDEPWWIIMPSIGGTAMAIFLSGLFLGAAVDWGGREAYKRAKRVSVYRQRMVEVPVGYVTLGPPSKRRNFLEDFLMGVPDDSIDWRIETAKQRGGNLEGAEAMDAARAENAAWRRMAMDGYQPPQPNAETSPQEPVSLDSGPRTETLVEEVALDPNGTWAIAKAEAKYGSMEAARRENLGWRMQHMHKGSPPQDRVAD